ncbi:MFS transporter, partial [Pseudorhodobacter sp.]|uniref:MFS transporter n=1 Tax=Pseudorhodobacter sp. TaxID=1934400 RepID=UPI0026479D2A
AALFAVAQAAWQINLAMALVGGGGAPVLVSGYYIFARVFSARMFGTLAGLMIGLGSLGNIASSLPLAFAVEAFGWRGTLWALAALTFVLAAGILLLVRDPERLGLTVKGSVLELLQMPAVWLILPIVAVNNLPIAGLRGLWVAPYLEQVFGLDATAIGKVTLAMGLAMVLGNLAYGPLDRLFGTRKWLIFAGNALMMFALVALCAWPARTLGFSTSMLAAVGFFGASFPMVMGHGRALFPPHLVGRGVTLLNFFGIGTIGVMQVATGQLYSRMQGTQAEEIIFPVIFAIYAILIAVALVVYLFAQDRTD